MYAPEIVSSELPRYSRRWFLKAALAIPTAGALAPLTFGCDSQPTQPPTIVRVVPAVPTESTQVEGEEWAKEKIEQLAESMRSDSQFRKISQAGEILYQNQQGNPAISSESSLFSDRRIRIFTVERIEHPTVRSVPMDAHILQEPPVVSTDLRSKNRGDNLKIQTGTSLSLDMIRISRTVMEDKSDFLLRLFVAKEVYNIHAFDLAINGVFSAAYAGYEIPDIELIKRALRVRLINWEIPPDGMPLYILADIWAHHIILPDYEQAKETGTFSEDELRSLSSLDYPSEHFKRIGLLYKDSDGQYRWRTEDMSFFYDQWYKAAFASWKTFF